MQRYDLLAILHEISESTHRKPATADYAEPAWIAGMSGEYSHIYQVDRAFILGDAIRMMAA